MRALGKPEKVDADTRFMIASNTKALTTLMLAKLVDAGKLDWNAHVTDVYPAFKLGNADTTKQVLVKHLICACTGLPRQDYEWLFEGEKQTPESVMATLGTMQPLIDHNAAHLIDDDVLLVLNKTDLASKAAPAEIDGHAVMPISAMTGAGIDTLVATLTTMAAARMATGATPPLTRQRHRQALLRVEAALQRGVLARLPELKGEDLRHAVQALGEITGRVDIEDILDVIFSEFCIGK